MKNETVESLMESGDVLQTEDVIHMLTTIISLLERDALIGIGIQLIGLWKDMLEAGQMEEAGVALDIVMGKP